jgi:hypothetical protein
MIEKKIVDDEQKGFIKSIEGCNKHYEKISQLIEEMIQDEKKNIYSYVVLQICFLLC